MFDSPRQPIALLSLATDPSGFLEAGKISPEAYYLRQLSEALVKLGWQVDLFTINYAFDQPKFDQPNIVEQTQHCRIIRLPGPVQSALVPEDNGTGWPQFFQAFRKFQAKEGTNYPLIHTSDWISGWAGLQLKQYSSVQWIHTAYPRIEPLRLATDSGMYAVLRAQTERLIWEQADQVVVTIPWEPGNQPWPFTPQYPVEIIPCGTDTQRFHTMPQVEARTKLALPPQDVILLYVGQFAPHKGIDTLVMACRKLQDCGIDFQLVLAGEDLSANLSIHTSSELNYGDHIRQMVADQGLAAKTSFPGHIGHDMLPFYYAAADACIIPSRYEPFGWVAIEAMACGTPVIASNVGGLRLTIAHEETGLLVPPQDAEALAGAIRRVLSDRVWANTLRELSSNRVAQHFSWTCVAARISDLYRRLLAQSLMGMALTRLQHSQRPTIPPAA